MHSIGRIAIATTVIGGIVGTYLWIANLSAITAGIDTEAEPIVLNSNAEYVVHPAHPSSHHAESAAIDVYWHDYSNTDPNDPWQKVEADAALEHFYVRGLKPSAGCVYRVPVRRE